MLCLKQRHRQPQCLAAMKSALTASLAGGAPPAPLPQTRKHTLDPAAFPCLSYADELDGVVAATSIIASPSATELANLLEGVEIVGSAPTSLLMPDGTVLVRPANVANAQHT